MKRIVAAPWGAAFIFTPIFRADGLALPRNRAKSEAKGEIGLFELVSLRDIFAAPGTLPVRPDRGPVFET
jgi:hypothetical protein